jgi:L-fuculose-phosphate aldolase
MPTSRSDDVERARAGVHAAALALVADGLVTGSSGNVSVRVDAERLVVTAGGVPYDRLVAADHPVLDLATGAVCDGTRPPSSEVPLHLGIMRTLPWVGAVVHTHSRYAAAFSVARRPLPFLCNENIPLRAAQVLVTRYAPPASEALADAVLDALAEQPGSRAVLLANHGVVAVAETLPEAELVARYVEWVAEVCHHAVTLGGEVHVLDRAVQDELAAAYGQPITRVRPPADR